MNDSTEFVNLYIAKQRNLINELQAKLLMLEVQFEISQAKVNQLVEENNKLKGDVEKAQKKKASDPTP
jgi:uncharacterized coiled-coil protein SlyX